MRVGGRIEFCAWILGIALLGCYAGARTSFETARAAGVEAFVASTAASARSPKAPADQSQTPFASFEVDQSLWSEERMSAFADSPAAPGDVKAVLRIPALQLEVPVYSGTTDANLNRGAAHIEGTAALTGHTGNIGIAAHRDGFFRNLKDVAIDDELHLALEGQSLRYRVVDLAVVLPHEVGVLAPTDVPSVTLVTCYPFYFVGAAPQRYIVRARRDDAPDDGPGAAVEEASGITENLHASTTRKSHEP
jgi:sortase A